jgi:hypothetical protein
MLQVVSEASPQHLRLHLDQAAYMKLPQTKFFFDPGVAKFNDSAPTAILCLRFRASQLIPELQDRRTFL